MDTIKNDLPILGKTLVNVEVNRRDEEIIFTTDSGEKYKMYHIRDCCEIVTIEDIVGDINDLIGKPLLIANEVINSYEASDNNNNNLELFSYQETDPYTYTFYTFATLKGVVTLRWYGTSNGYYSENVDFVKI